MNQYEKQAQDFLDKANATITFHLDRRGKSELFDDNYSRNIYSVIIKRGTKTYELEFTQSVNNTDAGIEPTAYDVLSCLTKYDVGSIDNYADEYGYDGVKISKLIAAYHDTVKEYEAVIELFGDVMEELREIQ